MAAGSPVCPEGLPDDAKEVWDWVVPELLAIGTLAKVDGGILEGYCRMMARARALEGEAAAVGGEKTDADVGARRWAAAEVRKLWPVVEKFATDLGLHYAARNRVTLPKPRETKDPAEKFLFGQLEALPGGKS